MRRGYLIRLLVLLSALILSVRAADAADNEDLPVPRFVSLKYGEVRLRQGPGERYPVVWVFTRRDMPVEITQQYDVWRKIRDWEGSEGWVLAGALQGKRWVVVKGAIRAIRSEPQSDAGLIARAEPGVLGRLDKCPSDQIRWCRIVFGDHTGWLQRDEIWGVYPNEVFPPP